MKDKKIGHYQIEIPFKEKILSLLFSFLDSNLLSPEIKTIQLTDSPQEQLSQKALYICGNAESGIPARQDVCILEAIMKMTHKKTKLEESVVKFDLKELMLLLGWFNTHESYKKIDSSLKKWGSLMLSYESDKMLDSFHLISSIVTAGGAFQSGQVGKKIDASFTIHWSEIGFQNIKHYIQSNYC